MYYLNITVHNEITVWDPLKNCILLIFDNRHFGSKITFKQFIAVAIIVLQLHDQDFKNTS